MGRHRGIGHLVRIDIGSVLIEGLKGFDEGIESFRVIFGDKKFNAEGIKGKDGGKGRINELEIPEFPVEGKEKNERGISMDRKDILKDEGGKKTGERISPVPAETLVKGISKDRREYRNVLREAGRRKGNRQ